MKNRVSKVSVVITTRNRSSDLRHCLGSLAGQSLAPLEVVVIDNNSSDETLAAVKNFAKAVRFPVRYLKEDKIGCPYSYNRGLVETKSEWVAFIDDDCVADVDWYRRLNFMVSHLPAVAVILGRSTEYHSQKILSLTKALIDEIGKLGAIQGRRVLDLEVLDSKNIVYNKTFLNQHQLKFDGKLLKYAQGANEDCDLGMQIAVAGGIAIYDDKMVVAHKDPSAIKAYYQKVGFMLFSHLVYEKKWSQVRSNYQTSRPLEKKIALYFDFIRRYQLNFYQACLVLANLVITFVAIKALRLAFSRKITGLKIKMVKS